MPDSPLPLPPAQRAELARLADRMRWIPAESQVAQLAAGVSRLLAHLARVEGERDEARTERDDACAMFGEAHERQKRAESDCDTARAESARLTRELAEARDALNYLRRKLDEGDALREVADAAEGRATLALAGGGA